MLVKFAPWWSWTAGSRCYLRTNPKGNVSASVLNFWEHLSWTPPGDVLSMHISEGQRMLLGNSSGQIEDVLRTSWGSHKAENLYHNQKDTFSKNFSNNQWRHRMSITFREHQLLHSAVFQTDIGAALSYFYCHHCLKHILRNTFLTF